MNDRFSLDGRVAIITGGGTGIGRGAALVLAEHGADVVLAARRANRSTRRRRRSSRSAGAPSPSRPT